jgi:hypothetical protein
MPKKPLSTPASVILGSIVGFAFFFGGYFLCVGNHEDYGWVLFLLVPSVSGFAIAMVVRGTSCLIACSIVACLLTLAMLIAVGQEGYLCCLMALPLLLAGMAIGALIGFIVRGRFLEDSAHGNRNTLLLMLACPFLMAAANQAEKPWRGVQRHETFATHTHVSATPEDTWQRLVRFETMEGDKPFLLRVGLPVPETCTLDKNSVGGERICHFDQGVIEQRVTEWRQAEGMKLEITKSTLPGRRWLTFVDASYELIPDAEGTEVIRRTKIASRLYPRWYWRPFEGWGVTSEHEYVLSSLKASLEKP